MEMDMVYHCLYAGTGLDGSYPDISNRQPHYLSAEMKEVKEGIVDINSNRVEGGG